MAKKAKRVKRVEGKQPGETLGRHAPMAELQTSARGQLDTFFERATNHVNVIQWNPAGVWRYVFDDGHSESIGDDFTVLGETADSIMLEVQRRNPGVTVEDDHVS